MKKTFYYMLLACILVVTGSAFSSLSVSGLNNNKPVRLHYQWFKDEDLTDATGTWGEMDAEIERLMDLFPGYVFTSEPSSSLIEFEFGKFPNHTPVIIYSNRYHNLSGK